MSDIPPIKEYGPGSRRYVQAQQIWVILIAHVMMWNKGMSRTVTYKELAQRMGYSGRAAVTLGIPLGIVGEYCILNGLPAINSIVVREDTNTPGDKVLVRNGFKNKIPKEQAAVYNINWFNYRVPTTGTLRKIWESLG